MWMGLLTRGVIIFSILSLGERELRFSYLWCQSRGFISNIFGLGFRYDIDLLSQFVIRASFSSRLFPASLVARFA